MVASKQVTVCLFHGVRSSSSLTHPPPQLTPVICLFFLIPVQLSSPSLPSHLPLLLLPLLCLKFPPCFSSGVSDFLNFPAPPPSVMSLPSYTSSCFPAMLQFQSFVDQALEKEAASPALRPPPDHNATQCNDGQNTDEGQEVRSSKGRKIQTENSCLLLQ